MFDNKPALEFNNSVQNRLTEIFQPLRDHLGIDHFGYARFYENNKSLCLTTERKIANFVLIKNNKNSEYFQKSISRIENSSQLYFPSYPKEDYILNYYYHIGLWNGLVLYKRSFNYLEGWTFLLKRNRNYSMEFYVKNIQFLKHFSMYFVDKVYDLINPLDPKKLAHYKCDIYFLEKPGTQKEKFLQATPIKKYYAECYGEELYLTPQEFECLKYYAQGRTMKEIARFKGIVPRTVEAHIDKIKKKTGYNFKNELAKFFEANFGF